MVWPVYPVYLSPSRRAAFWVQLAPATIRPKMQARLLRGSSIAIFLAGAFGVWYGFVMSFLVPGTLGEPYFTRDRILLGNVPLVGSFAALVAAGWMFFRSFSKPRFSLEQAIVYSIGGAAGLGWLYIVIGGLISQR